MDDEKEPDEVVDGASAAAKILNAMPEDRKQRILAGIKEAAPQAFLKVSANIFAFEDIPSITGNGLQILIREIQHEDLVLALKHATPSVKEALLKNMSKRKLSAVLEDIDRIGIVPEAHVYAAKKRIISRIDELRTAGVIHSEERDDSWV